MRIQTCGGVLVRDGQVLLGLRAEHKSFGGCWDLIGGHVEIGETPSIALQREMIEEIGVVVTAARPIEFIPDVQGTVLHIFHVSAWRGEPTLANEEHLAIRWFDLATAAALPNLALDAYRRLFLELR